MQYCLCSASFILLKHSQVHIHTLDPYTCSQDNTCTTECAWGPLSSILMFARTAGLPFHHTSSHERYHPAQSRVRLMLSVKMPLCLVHARQICDMKVCRPCALDWFLHRIVSVAHASCPQYRLCWPYSSVCSDLRCDISSVRHTKPNMPCKQKRVIECIEVLAFTWRFVNDSEALTASDLVINRSLALMSICHSVHQAE